MTLYTFVTINLQLRIQNTGVLSIVCVCKSIDAAFHIRAASINFNLQIQILILQVLTFKLASSRVLLLFYLHMRGCGVYISVCVHLWDMAGCLEHGCRVSKGKNFLLNVTTVNDVTTITICFYVLFDVSSLD